MPAGDPIWWRAEGGVMQSVDIVVFDAKRVTRIVDGKKIPSRLGGRGMFYCPDWE